MGEGKSREEAERKAQAGLAEYFGAQVRSDTAIDDFERQLDGVSTDGTTFRQTVEVRANQELAQVQFSDSYEEKGVYYVVAYLDKQKRAATISSEITALEQKRDLLVQRGDSEEEPLTQFAFYNNAINLSKTISTQKTFLQILTSAPVMDNLSLVAEIHQKRDEVAGSIILLLISDATVEEQIVTAVQKALEPLGFHLFFLRKEKEDSLEGEIFDYLAVLASGTEPVDLNNRYVNLRWAISLVLKDDQKIFLTWQELGRVSAINESAAIDSATGAMIKKVEREMVSALSQGLNQRAIGEG